jgi:hypothetical protein
MLWCCLSLLSQLVVLQLVVQLSREVWDALTAMSAAVATDLCRRAVITALAPSFLAWGCRTLLDKIINQVR